MRMKLSDFNYDLPKELVAEYPNKNRDEARLMVIDRKDYSIKHRQSVLLVWVLVSNVI